jgi:uncharacterized lipoprotein YmbA
MRPITALRRLMLALLVLLPAGCSSPNPVLYTLAPVAGQTDAGGPRYVELRDVTLPRYLERSQIVRSTEDFRLDVLANDWWGESLTSMFGRVLMQDLAQRLPNSTVYPETGAISVVPGATVAVNVHRFDADRTGALILDADLLVKRQQPAARHVHVAVPVSGPGTAALVGAMSTALGELADTAAGMVTGPRGR